MGVSVGKNLVTMQMNKKCVYHIILGLKLQKLLRLLKTWLK